MIAHAATELAGLLEKGRIAPHVHHGKVGRVLAHAQRHGGQDRVVVVAAAAEQLIAAHRAGRHGHADQVRREHVVGVAVAQRHMPGQEERGQLGAKLGPGQAVHDKVYRVVRVHKYVDQGPQDGLAVRVERGEHGAERAVVALVDLGARVELHGNYEQHDGQREDYEDAGDRDDGQTHHFDVPRLEVLEQDGGGGAGRAGVHRC